MPITCFDPILFRLKAQLPKVKSNKEIAELLGMTYGAFNARRQRGSFPEQKLRILSEKYPDLRLDIEHILKGTNENRPAHTNRWTPATDTPHVLHIGEQTVEHDLGATITAQVSPEQFASDRRKAAQQLDLILVNIGFTAAPTLLRNTMAELLQFKQLTPYAAQALLTIIRDDFIGDTSQKAP